MATDFSTHHDPVGGLFAASDDQGAYGLTEEQVRFYHENGYVAGVRMLSDEQIESLQAELAEFFEPKHAGREFWYEYHANESLDPDSVLFHALGAWRLRPGFHDLLWNPAFTAVAAQLLDGPVRFWHDQLFCKPARHGGVVAWHQDYSYWTRTEPMAHLTAWIALDDASVDNGCIQYIPGSHRWDLLPTTDLAGDLEGIREVLTPDQQAAFDNRVSVELKAGYATFHHPKMMHGSGANLTDRPRRATVINVFRDGVRSASEETLLEGVPPIPAGQPMTGRFFPLLSGGSPRLS